MMKHSFSLIFAILLLPFWVAAQQNDPVLFTVASTPVHVSEFSYIYKKTNGQQADFSKKSLEEYLELYTKFKLKVQKAKEMRLDTIPSLKTELEGYRRQLADSYLIDRNVTDKLLQEAYDRIQEDVDISHILISLSPTANPEDTLAAYNKALEAKKRLEKKEAFDKVAKEMSDDKSAEKNGGRIGFITALLPNGFYALETAVYTLPVGKISNPIRTNAGYHVIKVNAKRPARGEVEVAHILARVENPEQEANAKSKIDSIYKVLQAPNANFDELAKNVSDDVVTAPRGGYIGIFGINRYEVVFEDAAFGLEKDGAISMPFRSSIGWHVIKRINKRGIQPFSTEKARLEAKIKGDSRFEAAKVAMIQKIKQDNGFKENTKVLDDFIATLTDTFYTFKWKAPESKEILFSLGKNRVVPLNEFADYLSKGAGKRIRMGRELGTGAAVKSLYADFINETCMRFEEAQLESKYPDFKALMREYEEGILLFEATKMLVWDKASLDSTGLSAFHETVKQNYTWEERAITTYYKIIPEAKDSVEAIRGYAKLHSSEEVLKKFNTGEKPIVSAEERIIEKSKNLSNLKWEAGFTATAFPNNRDKTFFFTKVEKILPQGLKTLKEARGYVIADYQDFLERQWVEALQKEYKVTINQKVFQEMIKG